MTIQGDPTSFCAFPMCECPGEEPVCDDYDERLVEPYHFVEADLRGYHQRTTEARVRVDALDGRKIPLGPPITCLAHLEPEPCPTCQAYIAAGL